jgi:hypothetical protein
MANNDRTRVIYHGAVVMLGARAARREAVASVQSPS